MKSYLTLSADIGEENLAILLGGLDYPTVKREGGMITIYFEIDISEFETFNPEKHFWAGLEKNFRADTGLEINELILGCSDNIAL